MKFAATTELNGIRLTLIGHWSDLAAYYAGSDGNAWMFHTGSTYGGPWSNLGPLAKFREMFSKKHRGTLFEQGSTKTNPRPSLGSRLESKHRRPLSRAKEWSGYPDPRDPDNFWIDDKTGERVNAITGQRTQTAASRRYFQSKHQRSPRSNPALPYRPGCQVRVFSNQHGFYAVFVKQPGHWDYYTWSKNGSFFQGVMDPGKMKSMRASGYRETENVPDDLFAWIKGLFCKSSARKNPMNSLATYYDSGYKAGQASRRHDQGMVSFQTDWSRRAFALESGEDKRAAQTEWNRGYREGSGAGEKPHYFR